MSTSTAPVIANDGIGHEQMNVVIVGHVDHGKSTLVGRLLADTGSLPQGKIEKVRRECERNDKPFEYAFLLDALLDEQSQGITIDTARCFFKTAKRDYIIIDAPGHIEFLKNMISGAARAEAAFLVIDAKEGVRENSRRHGFVLRMLGIRQVCVVVNKMDLVNFSQAAYDAIEKEYREFLTGIGVTPRQFIPIAALLGDNMVRRADSMTWYKGPTVLEMADLFVKQPPSANRDLRMPVQDIYKFTNKNDERRILAGRIEAGRVKVGDTVVFSPSNKRNTIKSIEAFNAAPRTEIEAGYSTGFTFNQEFYARRGEIMSHLGKEPLVSTRFRANIIWLGKKDLIPGRWYKLKMHTSSIECKVAELHKVIDASELNLTLKKDTIGRHDVADVTIECKKEIAFDLAADCEITGRFVIVDGYEIAGGGIIVASVADQVDAQRTEARQRDLQWQPGAVPSRERTMRIGHPPIHIFVVGKGLDAKRRVARIIEKSLFSSGHAAYLLDGQNLFIGLDNDLAKGPNQHSEIVRRFAEVTHLLLDAGLLVVSVTNEIGLDDLDTIRELTGDVGRIVIDIDALGTSRHGADLSFLGTEDDGVLVAKVLDKLRGIKLSA